jgi:hypothetical protein
LVVVRGTWLASITVSLTRYWPMEMVSGPNPRRLGRKADTILQSQWDVGRACFSSERSSAPSQVRQRIGHLA